MNDMPTKPPEQRPEHPDFWSKRFTAGTTPWEAAEIPAAFARFAAQQATPLNTLIPGCGSARDAAHLAALGWPVTALDFSPAAVATARDTLEGTGVNLVCADFFSFEPPQPFQLIYERAFLCALPRKLWAGWGQRVAELLPPGGLLAGSFFVCDQLKGPPFGILPEELEALLSPHFECIETSAVTDSIPVFAGRERWLVWQRRG